MGGDGMTDSVEPDFSENSPMHNARFDETFTIHGLRLRRVAPGTRGDHHVARDSGTTHCARRRFEDRSLNSLNDLQTPHRFRGVLRQTAIRLRGFETKTAPATPQAVTPPEPQKVAMPLPGAEMPLKGAEISGYPDVAATPLRQNLNGDLTAFRRFVGGTPSGGDV